MPGKLSHPFNCCQGLLILEQTRCCACGRYPVGGKVSYVGGKVSYPWRGES